MVSPASETLSGAHKHVLFALAQVNIRRYNTVCGPGACESQEAAKGRLQNWELQKVPDPELVEVGHPSPWRTKRRAALLCVLGPLGLLTCTRHPTGVPSLCAGLLCALQIRHATA